jgi:hypothetical protein
MADMQETCEFDNLPGVSECGPLSTPSGPGCGHGLYVRSQADCSGCSAASTYVFVSADGTNWLYRETISNSGSSITSTFVETSSQYRFVLLGQVSLMFPPIPRWQNITVVPFGDDCL